MPIDDEIEQLKAKLSELERQKAQANEEHDAEPSFIAGRISRRSAKVGRTGKLAIALGVVASLVLAVAVMATKGPPQTLAAAPKVQDDDWKARTLAFKPGGPNASLTSWRYSDEVDPITGGKVRFACVTSVDQVELSFPYEPTTAELCIRRRNGDTSVYYQLNKTGQIICDSYRSCPVRVRFDKQQAITFAGGEPADHSSDLVFIKGSAKFVQAIRSAETTRIALVFYQAGQQTVEFPTEGLDVTRLGMVTERPKAPKA